MEVVGVGFGRTGTLSLKAALETLGYGPCYHMTEVFDKPAHAAFWEAAADAKARGEAIDFEKVFSGYEATVDWPGCFFWRELIEAYPEAKVLLTVRDSERWFESAEATIAGGPDGQMPSPDSGGGRLMLWFAGLFMPAMRHAPGMIQKTILEGTFGGRFHEKGPAIDVFESHIDEVRRTVPEEKLLVYEVSQGWEPLCDFLDVEVPDEPFPRLNDRKSFPKMMRRGMLRAAAPRVAGAVAIGTVAVLSGLTLARHRTGGRF